MVNCERITTYRTGYPSESSNKVETTTKSSTVYTKGNVHISFDVYAVNNDNKESVAASASMASATLRK